MTLLICCRVFWCLVIIHPSLSLSIDPQLFSKVQLAMKTTVESQQDIYKAYEACDIWDSVSFKMLPDNVRARAFALYAACLVRVGRDSKAIDIYDSCLTLRNVLGKTTLDDIMIGRASALQRRMLYNEAVAQYLESSTPKGTLGAVTCSLRLQNLEGAIEILDKRIHPGNVEITAITSLLQILQRGIIERNDDLAALKAASKTLPLFHWIYCILKCPGKVDLFKFDILDIASINQNSFDDPLLIHLDDKTLLHALLCEEKDGFWPKGFILPYDKEKFQNHLADNRIAESWIIKSASGYGSHGNMITTGKEVLNLLEKPILEPFLCQSLIDKSLLFEKRKFSVRVYVYYFLDEDLYISSVGLVKLASEIYEDAIQNDRMYMTNSGREDNMLQYDFAALRNHFQKVGRSYDIFWGKIEHAIYATMHRYEKKIRSEKIKSYRQQLTQFCIPKILGFDFVVTESLQPMLLEVNRFPGLEARGASDTPVKETVVRDAWICAMNRLGLTKSKNHSYKKINDTLRSQ